MIQYFSPSSVTPHPTRITRWSICPHPPHLCTLFASPVRGKAFAVITEVTGPPVWIWY